MVMSAAVALGGQHWVSSVTRNVKLAYSHHHSLKSFVISNVESLRLEMTSGITKFSLQPIPTVPHDHVPQCHRHPHGS